MEAVEERICDQPVLKLLRAMLRTGASEDGQIRGDSGRDRARRGDQPRHVQRLPAPAGPGRGMSDDGVPDAATPITSLCRSRGQAEAALDRLTDLLAGLGLEPEGRPRPVSCTRRKGCEG